VRVKEVAQKWQHHESRTGFNISKETFHDAKMRRKRRQRLVKGYLKKDYKFKIGTSRKTLIQELLRVKHATDPAITEDDALPR
jgi:hypothetical protein